MNAPKSYTRRDFLRSSLPLAAAFGTVPHFLSQTVLAAPNTDTLSSIPGMPDDRILIVLQLSGGNDGLNTLVPYEDARYFNLRPELSLRPRDLIRINDQIGLHPALQEAQRLFDDGDLAWIQKVGYPNPNRSHFRSMEIWETASGANRKIPHGWLGRYIDAQCGGEDPIPATAAITIGNELPQALRTPAGGAAGVVVDDPNAYAWKPAARSSTQDACQRGLFLEQTQSGLLNEGPAHHIEYLQRTAMDAALSSDLIAQAAQKYRSRVEYPNHRLGRDMQLIARFIGGGLKSRVFYLRHGGFDTHADQPGVHERLLRQLAESLSAFRRDMTRQGHWERILLMGFSEFGRRAAENNSQGTDHGAAGPMLLVGGQVKGGLHGNTPDLGKLVNGDVPHETDFRAVYGTVLDQWLGLPHAPILGNKYDQLALLR